MPQPQVLPKIMVVDDDPAALRQVQQELQKRYGADYAILCHRQPDAALDELATLAGEEIALILADQWMPEMDGIEFLDRAHDLHPRSLRVLLTTWGNRNATEAVSHALTLGQIHDTVLKPWTSPDERFHKTVTGYLEQWARVHQPHFEMVKVVGERWSRSSHEYRDLLDRNGIPYGFYDRASAEGQALLREVGLPDGPFPVVILADGAVFADPKPAEVADALDASTSPVESLYDLTIVGSGPAGLSAAVYGASEGLQTMVVEREAIGGQAGTSSMIRNYLGFPRGISGAELANRAYQQAWLFGADFTFMRGVVELRSEADRHVLILSDGSEIASRAVVLAMGVAYRRLGIPELEALVGAGVYYGAAVTEAQAMRGQPEVVVGGGNSAGQAAAHLSDFAARVTLVVRGESLVDSMSEYLIQELENCKNVDMRYHSEIVGGRGRWRLEEVDLRDCDTGHIETLPAAGLFIHIGAQPHTDWLPDTVRRDSRGYILTGRSLLDGEQPPPEWPLARMPWLFETSVPGIFAVGDVRYHSVKRVASAVGDGSIVVQLVHAYLQEQADAR